MALRKIVMFASIDNEGMALSGANRCRRVVSICVRSAHPGRRDGLWDVSDKASRLRVSAERLQALERGRKQLAHRGVDAHAALELGVGELRVVRVDEGMHGLVDAGAAGARHEDPGARLIDVDVAEDVGFDLYNGEDSE